MAHTGGTWIAKMLGGGKGSGGNDWSVRVDCEDGNKGEFAIAIVRRKPGGEAAANARLIAAAPSLLKALEKVVRILEADGGSIGCIGGELNASEFRKIIVKARGKK